MKIEIETKRKMYPGVPWMLIFCGLVISLVGFLPFNIFFIVSGCIFILSGIIGLIIWYSKGWDKPDIVTKELEVESYRIK